MVKAIELGLLLVTNMSMMALADEPVVVLWERPLKDWQGARKVTFDRLVATIPLVFIVPLLAVVEVLIRFESPGAVLFRQHWVGYDNRLFSILKFRSMRTDATDRLTTRQTVHGDSRVTRGGGCHPQT